MKQKTFVFPANYQIDSRINNRLDEWLEANPDIEIVNCVTSNSSVYEAINRTTGIIVYTFFFNEKK